MNTNYKQYKMHALLDYGQCFKAAYNLSFGTLQRCHCANIQKYLNLAKRPPKDVQPSLAGYGCFPPINDAVQLESLEKDDNILSLVILKLYDGVLADV